MKYRLGTLVFTKGGDDDEYWHSQSINYRSCSFDLEMLVMMGAEPIEEPEKIEEIDELDFDEWMYGAMSMEDIVNKTNELVRAVNMLIKESR